MTSAAKCAAALRHRAVILVSYSQFGTHILARECVAVPDGDMLALVRQPCEAEGGRPQESDADDGANFTDLDHTLNADD